MARTPIAGIHVWTEDDNWWELAHRYTGTGLNWVLLVDANPHITNPNLVPAGTRVNVPRELVE